MESDFNFHLQYVSAEGKSLGFDAVCYFFLI